MEDMSFATARRHSSNNGCGDTLEYNSPAKIGSPVPVRAINRMRSQIHTESREDNTSKCCVSSAAPQYARLLGYPR